MASIINEIIPNQGFEIVLNKIGVIVLEELSNQKIIQPIDSDFEVFIERQEPYANSEDVVINISYENSDFGGKTQKDVQGNTTFSIDIYTTGIESAGQTGNDDARIKALKYAGMIRYILSSTKYKTLGYAPGLIGGSMVENITNQTKYGNEDASFIKFVRVTFSVRIQENQEAWTGIPLLGNDTTIKLDMTDKGYKLTL
jgi:hypothetical protein